MKLQAFVRRLPASLRRHKLLQTIVRLRPSLAVQESAFNGNGRLFVDLRDANARTYFLRGTFEPEFFAIAEPFITPRATVFDIGANFGFCTFGLMTSTAHRERSHHLFEANPNLCELLRRSAELNAAEAVVNHCCVSDEPGESRLTFVPGDWGQSFVGADGTVSVPNLRLDDYCARKKIATVHFTKIDIEGYEPHALRGAAKMMTTGGLQVIYLEISGMTLARQGFTPAIVFGLLKDAGYRVFFCKPSDLATVDRLCSLDVNGRNLPLAECTGSDLPANIHTDLLAIHQEAGFTVSR